MKRYLASLMAAFILLPIIIPCIAVLTMAGVGGMLWMPSIVVTIFLKLFLPLLALAIAYTIMARVKPPQDGNVRSVYFWNIGIPLLAFTGCAALIQAFWPFVLREFNFNYDVGGNSWLFLAISDGSYHVILAILCFLIPACLHGIHLRERKEDKQELYILAPLTSLTAIAFGILLLLIAVPMTVRFAANTAYSADIDTPAYDGIALVRDADETKAESKIACPVQKVKRKRSVTGRPAIPCDGTKTVERIRDVPFAQCPKENRLRYSNEGGRIAADPNAVYARDEFVPCRVKQCTPDRQAVRMKRTEGMRLFKEGKIVSCAVGKKKLMSGQFVEVRKIIATSKCPKNNRRNGRYKGILGPNVSTLP